jgi:hypothetical protein
MNSVISSYGPTAISTDRLKCDSHGTSGAITLTWSESAAQAIVNAPP